MLIFWQSSPSGKEPLGGANVGSKPRTGTGMAPPVFRIPLDRYTKGQFKDSRDVSALSSQRLSICADTTALASSSEGQATEMKVVKRRDS